MKGLRRLGVGLLLLGVFLLLAPWHVQMTGLVLIPLGLVVGGYGALKTNKEHKMKKKQKQHTNQSAVGGIGLMSCMNLIFCAGITDWDSACGSEYAIVLGSGVRADGTPSRIMETRLQAALEFMVRNETAIVILSGGQGADEPISEAQCMYDTLVAMGADASRLRLEDESSTTRENLINSMALIDALGGTTAPVTVITSEFHQCRAAYIAELLRLNTCPVSGRTDQWFFRINYTLREVFAFVKAAALGIT